MLESRFNAYPRVIDVPRWKWWLVLNLFILPTRPKQSAAKYARIWGPVTGSPLLHYTRRQAELLQQAMPDVPVIPLGHPETGRLPEGNHESRLWAFGALICAVGAGASALLGTRRRWLGTN